MLRAISGCVKLEPHDTRGGSMPAHSALIERMEGILTTLRGVHKSGRRMSATTQGDERRAVVDKFLRVMFPAPFRFGKGDCIDQAGRKSGELGIVMEYPFLPS